MKIINLYIDKNYFSTTSQFAKGAFGNSGQSMLLFDCDMNARLLARELRLKTMAQCVCV